MQTLVDNIIREIRNISDEYQKNQGLILSEADLKCHIFRKIYDLIPNHNMITHDPEITGSPLHSEIRFYDEDGKLRLVPDITILDPAGMSIKHGMSIRIKGKHLAYGKIPSCGFEFTGRLIVIEIKFEKSRKGISKATVQKIRDDLEKIARLMGIGNQSNEDDVLGIMVIFNKTDKYDSSFKQLLQEYESNKTLKIIYGTGNVILTRSQVILENGKEKKN
ncbi:MAG: hypothetical protein ACLP2P_01645 [Desulfobaccales bacterium]